VTEPADSSAARSHEDDGGRPGGPPERVDDLLPKRLYLAEVLTLPVFWFAPLMLVVFAWLMSSDYQRLVREYGVEFSSRYLYYFTPFVLGTLGSLAYRGARRQQVRKHIGFGPGEFDRLKRDLGIPKGRPVRAWFLLLVVLLVGAILLPESVVGRAFGYVLLANVVVGPLVSATDLYRLQGVDALEWGPVRFVHPFVAALPLGILVYMVQRDEHVEYSALVVGWTVHPDEYAVPEAEQSLQERLAARLDDVGL
jgi:hypothetical protein